VNVSRAAALVSPPKAMRQMDIKKERDGGLSTEIRTWLNLEDVRAGAARPSDLLVGARKDTLTTR
jgi:hypothetical protein